MREINGLKFVVWENVKGVLSDGSNAFGCLLAGLAGDGAGENPVVPPGKSWPLAGHVLSRDEHGITDRSEEHTSELQSLMRSSYAVFCLKKKTLHFPLLHGTSIRQPSQLHE